MPFVEVPPESSNAVQHKQHKPEYAGYAFVIRITDPIAGHSAWKTESVQMVALASQSILAVVDLQYQSVLQDSPTGLRHDILVSLICVYICGGWHIDCCLAVTGQAMYGTAAVLLDRNRAVQHAPDIVPASLMFKRKEARFRTRTGRLTTSSSIRTLRIPA